MELAKNQEIRIVYAEEKYIESFRQSLDEVAREEIYLEMVEAMPLEKIRDFQMKLVQNNYPAYYAIMGDKVVGWCDISVSDNPRMKHRGHMGMGLVQAYRGIGLGEKLLSAALEHAKKIGLEQVELSVYADNSRALGLYRKLGFQEVGFKKNWRKLGNRSFDAILMDLFF